jgi:RNA polymerase sigma-70 factor (ECF subfamily)
MFQAQWQDVADMTHEVDGRDDEMMMKAMLKAIKKLKAPEMEMIEMRFFEKRSFREIGEILGMTENNAKVKMFRIIQRLKKLMDV